MKKTLKVVGGIGAGILLVMAMMSTVVCAQATRTSIKEIVSDIQSKKTSNERIQSLQQIKNKILDNGWYPGWILVQLFVMFLNFLWYLTQWLISPHN